MSVQEVWTDFWSEIPTRNVRPGGVDGLLDIMEP